MATEIGDAIPRFRALSRLHVQDSGLRLQQYHRTGLENRTTCVPQTVGRLIE